MLMYFFDYSENGRVFSDTIGSLLADDASAQHEANSALFDMIRTSGACRQRKIEITVRDANGRAVYHTALELTGMILDEVEKLPRSCVHEIASP